MIKKYGEHQSILKLDINVQLVTPGWTRFRLDGEQTEIYTVVITYNYYLDFFLT